MQTIVDVLVTVVIAFQTFILIKDGLKIKRLLKALELTNLALNETRTLVAKHDKSIKLLLK